MQIQVEVPSYLKIKSKFTPSNRVVNPKRNALMYIVSYTYTHHFFRSKLAVNFREGNAWAVTSWASGYSSIIMEVVFFQISLVISQNFHHVRIFSWYNLGGGFKDFLFSPLPGEWSNLTNIFQMGWNPPTSNYIANGSWGYFHISRFKVHILTRGQGTFRLCWDILLFALLVYVAVPRGLHFRWRRGFLGKLTWTPEILILERLPNHHLRGVHGSFWERQV